MLMIVEAQSGELMNVTVCRKNQTPSGGKHASNYSKGLLSVMRLGCAECHLCTLPSSDSAMSWSFCSLSQSEENRPTAALCRV